VYSSLHTYARCFIFFTTIFNKLFTLLYAESLSPSCHRQTRSYTVMSHLLTRFPNTITFVALFPSDSFYPCRLLSFKTIDNRPKKWTFGSISTSVTKRKNRFSVYMYLKIFWETERISRRSYPKFFGKEPTLQERWPIIKDFQTIHQ
jgi:hypothetical protein